MRRPYHKTVILVVAVIAVVSVVAIPYFRESETQLHAEPSSEDGFEANSVFDSATSTLDASDKPSLSAAESVSDSPADPSELTTDVIIEQMKQGNFSNVDLGQFDIDIDKLDTRFRSDNAEWVECYLNENGLKGLVMQVDSDNDNWKGKRIQCIFALSNDQAICVWAYHGARINCYLSANGNLIRNYGTYGTSSNDSYTHFIFDDGLNQIWLYSLHITAILDWYEEQVREELSEIWDDDAQRKRLLSEWGSDATTLEELIESYPEKTTTGEYYKRIDRTGEEKVEEKTLTKQQFLDAFEEMTGLSFYDVNPEGMYMRDDLEAGEGQSN